MLLGTLERRRARRVPGPTAPLQPATHLLWFCDAMLLFFALPWLAIRVVGLGAGVYLAVELGVSIVFLSGYGLVARPQLGPGARRLAASLGVGVACATVVATLVVAGIDETARPGGVGLVGAVLWRGLVDGAASSLVLVAFPAAVARQVARTAPTSVEPWMRVFLSFVLIWSLSAAHHLGFAQYDDRSLLPVEVTTSVIALPAIATGNPAGSALASVVMHLAVVVHGYETDAIAPPQRDVVRGYVPPGLFPPPELDRNGSFPN